MRIVEVDATLSRRETRLLEKELNRFLEFTTLRIRPQTTEPHLTSPRPGRPGPNEGLSLAGQRFHVRPIASRTEQGYGPAGIHIHPAPDATTDICFKAPRRLTPGLSIADFRSPAFWQGRLSPPLDEDKDEDKLSRALVDQCPGEPKDFRKEETASTLRRLQAHNGDPVRYLRPLLPNLYVVSAATFEQEFPGSRRLMTRKYGYPPIDGFAAYDRAGPGTDPRRLLICPERIDDLAWRKMVRCPRNGWHSFARFSQRSRRLALLLLGLAHVMARAWVNLESWFPWPELAERYPETARPGPDFDEADHDEELEGDRSGFSGTDLSWPDELTPTGNESMVMALQKRHLELFHFLELVTATRVAFDFLRNWTAQGGTAHSRLYGFLQDWTTLQPEEYRLGLFLHHLRAPALFHHDRAMRQVAMVLGGPPRKKDQERRQRMSGFRYQNVPSVSQLRTHIAGARKGRDYAEVLPWLWYPDLGGGERNTILNLMLYQQQGSRWPDLPPLVSIGQGSGGHDQPVVRRKVDSGVATPLMTATPAASMS